MKGRRWSAKRKEAALWLLGHAAEHLQDAKPGEVDDKSAAEALELLYGLVHKEGGAS